MVLDHRYVPIRQNRSASDSGPSPIATKLSNFIKRRNGASKKSDRRNESYPRGDIGEILARRTRINRMRSWRRSCSAPAQRRIRDRAFLERTVENRGGDMRYGSFPLALAALCWCAPPAFAATCTSQQDRGRSQDTFVCPVQGGGQVRAGDVCAREGGTVDANRGKGRHHNGLDINAAEGTDVFAAKPGRVALAAANWGALGNTVIIDHEDGDYSVYGHLRTLKTRRNRCVNAGDLIGLVGYTGNAKCLRDNHLSSHLHFAVIRASRAGLIDRNGPLAGAIKSNDRWGPFGKKFFAGDGLGIQDPQVLLQPVSGCLK
jgi:murein DD-endopeptidase MepM/ murein hydrolase activator NlpD